MYEKKSQRLLKASLDEQLYEIITLVRVSSIGHNFLFHRTKDGKHATSAEWKGAKMRLMTTVPSPPYIQPDFYIW